MVDFETLVLDVEDLDSNRVNDFISGLTDVGCLLIFSALKEDEKLLEFIEEFSLKHDIPYAGLKVTGFFSDGNYRNNCLGFVALQGVKANLFTGKLDFEDIEDCVKSLREGVNEGLNFVFSANTYPECGVLDEVLRRVVDNKPDIILYGGISAPDPIVFSNDGFFGDGIIFLQVSWIKYEYNVYSGYEINEDASTHIATNSEREYITKIDGENPVTLYCNYKSIPSYLMNTIVKLSLKANMAELASKMANLNKSLYDSLIKGTIEVMGYESSRGQVEPIFITNFNEEKSKIQTIRSNNKKLKLNWITTNGEKQVKTYQKVNQENTRYKNTFIFSCGYVPFYYRCNHNLVEQQLQKFKTKVFTAYMWGEIGGNQTDLQKGTLVHGGTLTTLNFQ